MRSSLSRAQPLFPYAWERDSDQASGTEERPLSMKAEQLYVKVSFSQSRLCVTESAFRST